MRRILCIASLIAVACGGSQKKGSDASDLDLLVDKTDPGMKCLMDAETARQPPADAPERIDVAHLDRRISE